MEVLTQTGFDLFFKYPLEVTGACFMSFGFLQAYFTIGEWIKNRFFRKDDLIKFLGGVLFIGLIILWSLIVNKLFSKYSI
jgi:hypothetical protein